ncbi:DUF6801 domain-containing protein [Streptomyces sp. NPDC091416]|uniref:DUF6801 domain-containing protein n=1 Tax=Streptomyces sp. NPDC091416 TaxID=3366003 RepID=UPI003820C05E
MMMRGTTGRSRGHLAARGGAVLAAVLMAGMIPGAQASAGGDREVQSELTYGCDFPSGSKPVTVRVSATVPEKATVDQPVQLRNVRTELTLDGEALADLPDAGAAGSRAKTQLTVDVAQGDRTAVTTWAGTAENPVAVPESEELTFSSAGEVPTVTAGASGDLTFTAAKLTASITPPASDGASAEPPAVQLTCTPAPDQDLSLVSVPVGAGPRWSSPEPSGSREGKAPAGGVARNGGVKPEVGDAAEPTLQDGKAPRCVGDAEDQLSLNAYVTGYANVAKLKSATLFPVACTQIHQGATSIKFQDGHLHVFQESTAMLDYQGQPKLPPATGTFLTFGFMPTTATMEMTQIPPAAGPDGKPLPNIHSDLTILSPGNSVGTTTIDMQLQLRLYDVKVNGVPLDVGPNCRTAKPFALPLRGEMLLKDGVQTGYTLVTGGALAGKVTIPPFSGCGVGEDLDDLFTASISGVPGDVKQIQAAPCAAAQHDPNVCTEDGQPVRVPKPQR